MKIQSWIKTNRKEYGAPAGQRYIGSFREANCPYLKVGERVPNLIIDDTQEQLRFA
nr:MAG TPA: hypothetical protein [Caudoviricetes sp.]